MHVVQLLAGDVAVAFAQHVLEPQLERIDAELVGEQVDRELARPRRLHLPVTAEGAVRRQVRVDAVGVDPRVLPAVRAGAGEAHLLSDAGAAVGVGAGVGPAPHPTGDEGPVGARAELDSDDGRMAVQRLPLLVTVEHGLHRPPRLARERGDDRLEPDERLRAERAAHRRADDSHRLLRQVEDARELVAEVERRLRARPDLQPVARPARDRRVRLHHRVLRSGDPEGAIDHGIARAPQLLRVAAVADPEAVADVRTRLRAHVEVRRVVLGDSRGLVHEPRFRLRRLDRVVARRQLLVVDLDRVERLGRLGSRRRSDRRDRIARVESAVDRQHRRILDLRPVAAVASDVVARDDDARYRGSVDRPDPRVRVRRAEDARVEHPLELDVLRVRDAAADPCVDHAASSSSARRTSTAITRLR